MLIGCPVTCTKGDLNAHPSIFSLVAPVLLPGRHDALLPGSADYIPRLALQHRGLEEEEKTL